MYGRRPLAFWNNSVLVNSKEAEVQSMLSVFYAEDKLPRESWISLRYGCASLSWHPNIRGFWRTWPKHLTISATRKHAIQYAEASVKNGFTAD